MALISAHRWKVRISSLFRYGSIFNPGSQTALKVSAPCPEVSSTFICRLPVAGLKVNRPGPSRTKPAQVVLPGRGRARLPGQPDRIYCAALVNCFSRAGYQALVIDGVGGSRISSGQEASLAVFRHPVPPGLAFALFLSAPVILVDGLDQAFKLQFLENFQEFFVVSALPGTAVGVDFQGISRWMVTSFLDSSACSLYFLPAHQIAAGQFAGSSNDISRLPYSFNSREAVFSQCRRYAFDVIGRIPRHTLEISILAGV